MKEEIKRFFIGGDHFKREFWQEMRVLVLFTLGFTIAFTWRQTIFDSMESIVKFFIDIKGNVTLSVTTSAVTTVLCLLIIWGMSKFLEDK